MVKNSTFYVIPSLVDSHVQFRKMIVRSNVSVYQIFQRFRLGKPEFPGRWTAKPYSHLPTPLPFLLNSLFLFLRFLLFSRFLLLSSLLRARVSFIVRRYLGNWIVASNSTQDRGKEARCSIPLFLLLCLRPRRNFRIQSCLNFFSYASSILLLAAGRRETCSVSVFIAFRLNVNAMVE